MLLQGLFTCLILPTALSSPNTIPPFTVLCTLPTLPLLPLPQGWEDENCLPCKENSVSQPPLISSRRAQKELLFFPKGLGYPSAHFHISWGYYSFPVFFPPSSNN